MPSRARPQGCCRVEAPSPLPEAERERLCEAFRALSDPTRLEIFRLICRQSGPVCACDVVERFELSQPTISHHLKVLRESGLLRSSRRGLFAFYAPDPRGIALLGEMGTLGCLGDRAA